ncbi:2',3'-cyclic-nucleotide 2'-phosphodiesterase (5'-nucleotidase family) [Bacillus sp. SLBN-46]|nr:hypothetical protein [Bacillus sp. SLBN-46]MDR6125159.1 2',3'-cyclic-nucleotide 2'-phosphodiesterase (5'-nucleotidase family) [Bacillus sp. SLBN-46]
MVKTINIILVSVLVIIGQLLPTRAFAQKPESTVQLRLLGTTDLHVFLELIMIIIRQSKTTKSVW